MIIEMHLTLISPNGTKPYGGGWRLIVAMSTTNVVMSTTDVGKENEEDRAGFYSLRYCWRSYIDGFIGLS